MALSALAITSCQTTSGVTQESAVFCSASAGARVLASAQVLADAQVLAVAATAAGRLRFGVSVWSPEGSNISVFGVADQGPLGWRYAETNGRCTIDLSRDAGGGMTVHTDAAADCHAYGGHGSRIGTLHFTAAQSEGPVKTELDDPEAFQHAGRCAGAH